MTHEECREKARECWTAMGHARIMANRYSGSLRSSRSGRVTSDYKGVSLHSQTSKWQANLWDGGRNIYLGKYETEEEAARAYDRAARERWGSDCYLNFPDER